MTDIASNMKSAFSSSLPSWEAVPSCGGMPSTDDTDECDDDDDDDDDGDGWVDLELDIDEEIELLVSADGEDQKYMQLKLNLEEIFDEYFTTSKTDLPSFRDSVRQVLHTLFNSLLKTV